MTLIPGQGKSSKISLRKKGAYQIPKTVQRWVWLGHLEQRRTIWCKVRGAGKSYIMRESRRINSLPNGLEGNDETNRGTREELGLGIEDSGWRCHFLSCRRVGRGEVFMNFSWTFVKCDTGVRRESEGFFGHVQSIMPVRHPSSCVE